jgi:hypothetical protein
MLLSLAVPGSGAAQGPASPWSSSADLQILSGERESLLGVKQLAVSVNVPAELQGALPAAPLQSTVVFNLEQAGLVVLATRGIADPLLAIHIRTLAERDGRGRDTGRVVYRVYGDLLQLVRLADHAGKARITLASTWHAGNFGVTSGTGAEELRARVTEIVDAFLADYRASESGQPTSPATPRLFPPS